MTKSTSGFASQGRSLLLAADEAYAPSMADQARMKVRLARTLAGAPAAAPDAPNVESAGELAGSAGSGLAAGMLGKATILALVMGGAGFGAGFWTGRQVPQASVRVTDAGPAARLRSDIAQTPAFAPSSHVESAEKPPVTPPRPAQAPRQRRRASAVSADGSAAPTRLQGSSSASSRSNLEPPAQGRGSTSALWQETQLLRRAQHALRGGDGRLAWALLDQLAQEFPSGALVEERQAAWVLTFCALGQTAEARARYQGFVERHPASVHLERLRASCAATSVGQAAAESVDPASPAEQLEDDE